MVPFRVISWLSWFQCSWLARSLHHNPQPINHEIHWDTKKVLGLKPLLSWPFTCLFRFFMFFTVHCCGSNNGLWFSFVQFRDFRGSTVWKWQLAVRLRSLMVHWFGSNKNSSLALFRAFSCISWLNCLEVALSSALAFFRDLDALIIHTSYCIFLRIMSASSRAQDLERE